MRKCVIVGSFCPVGKGHAGLMDSDKPSVVNNNSSKFDDVL